VELTGCYSSVETRELSHVERDRPRRWAREQGAPRQPASSPQVGDKYRCACLWPIGTGLRKVRSWTRSRRTGRGGSTHAAMLSVGPRWSCCQSSRSRQGLACVLQGCPAALRPAPSSPWCQPPRWARSFAVSSRSGCGRIRRRGCRWRRRGPRRGVAEVADGLGGLVCRFDSGEHDPGCTEVEGDLGAGSRPRAPEGPGFARVAGLAFRRQGGPPTAVPRPTTARCAERVRPPPRHSSSRPYQ
jgi:hypothetical protein